MRSSLLLPAVLLLTASVSTTALSAQAITVRDKLVALPPVSICQDGATHQTIATKHRLRPGVFDLSKFVGMPVEVTGTPGAITCKYVDVTAIKVTSENQSSVASKTATTAKVEFFGTPASVYMLFLGGLASSPLFLPGINGPIHLDPNAFVFLGVYTPASASVPYATFTAPLSSVSLGINIYDQAVAIKTGYGEMTNVDTFKF